MKKVKVEKTISCCMECIWKLLGLNVCGYPSFQKEMPLKIRMIDSVVEDIPDWCPLEDVEE